MNQIILAAILIYQRQYGFIHAGFLYDWALRFESFYQEASLNGQKAYRNRGDDNMSQTIQITDELQTKILKEKFWVPRFPYSWIFGPSGAVPAGL